MRNSLKKLRAGFGINNKHGGGKVRRLPEPGVAQLDGLARATQDMLDMRDCYDSLLSAAAATGNSAYELSESLKEMGSCLLEKTALNDDEESGEVLLMMGKVQFELQRLVDKYRSHIFQTIISPSESLLNELRIVEEMKRLCDEKRTVYEHMKSTCKEKGRSKSKKGASFSAQELQTAYDEYDEEATLFVFRLKSLKQGQSRSLLTQAARHHASQSCFFRKALKSLEAVEPHVKFVTTQQHIDYQFSGLDDSNSEEDSDDEDDYEGSVSEVSDGELSYDDEPNVKEQNTVSRPRDSMLLDKAEVTLPRVATKENLDRPGQNSFAFGREKKASSQSAPLFVEKKFDPAERVRQMRQLSSRRFNSYVLPTPVEPKSPVSTKPDPQVFQMRQSYMSNSEINYRHSSPLVHRNYVKIPEKGKTSAPLRLSQPPVLRESNAGTTSTSLPPPLAEELSSQHHDQHSTSDAKKTKRQAFSGPLTDKSWPNKRGLASTGSLDPAGPPKLFSGPLVRTPVPHRSTSPKVSPSASPTFVSSPKISELHELPRPPLNKLAGRLSSQVGNSGPLISIHEISTVNRLVPKSASLLPPPPLSMARSFSTPSRGQKVTGLPTAMPLGIPQTKSVENLVLPPLSPISSSSIQSTWPAS